MTLRVPRRSSSFFNNQFNWLNCRLDCLQGEAALQPSEQQVRTVTAAVTVGARAEVAPSARQKWVSHRQRR